jgi:hypothetical protein
MISFSEEIIFKNSGALRKFGPAREHPHCDDEVLPGPKPGYRSLSPSQRVSDWREEGGLLCIRKLAFSADHLVIKTGVERIRTFLILFSR